MSPPKHRFLATANNGKIYQCYDGVNWKTLATIAEGVTMRSICYGNDRYVAVGNSGKSYYSFDAKTWTAMSGLNIYNYYSVCYGNGLFVAVGGSSSKGWIAYSIDGEKWTHASVSISYCGNEAIYANGKFVAMFGRLIYYSTNGTSWYSATINALTAIAYNYQGVAYGDKFVAAGSSYLGTSTNGTTWDLVSSHEQFIAQNFINTYKVAYGLGKYVVTGQGTIVGYSTNGTSWSRGTYADTEGLLPSNINGDVKFGGDRFVFVGECTDSVWECFYSTNGIEWYKMGCEDTDIVLYGVLYE